MIETLAWYPSKSNSEVYHIIKCDVVCVGNEVLTFRQFWLLYWILMKTNVTLSDILVIIISSTEIILYFPIKYRFSNLLFCHSTMFQCIYCGKGIDFMSHVCLCKKMKYLPNDISHFILFFFFKSFGGVGRI